MVRLSILIPALKDNAAFESTLVSVLSNRPADCVVLVVLSQPYDDPYQLTDEVRFVDAPRGSGWAAAVNCGFEASQGSVVHVLHPGVEVTEGWTQLASRHFNHPQVAAVAPLVLNGEQPDRVMATEVQYHQRGERLISGAGISACAAPALVDALGPTCWAGFYRRSAVHDLLGGFDLSVGDRHCDVDLALRLRNAGYRCVTESRSQVLATPSLARSRGMLRSTLGAERLFWRNVSGVGAAVSHAAMVSGELVRSLPASPALLVARLWAACEIGGYLKHRARLKAQRRQVSISLALAESSGRQVRIDPAEPTISMSRRPTRQASPRRAAA